MSFERKQRPSVVMPTCHPSIGKMKQMVHPGLDWTTDGDTTQKKEEAEEKVTGRGEEEWKKRKRRRKRSKRGVMDHSIASLPSCK